MWYKEEVTASDPDGVEYTGTAKEMKEHLTAERLAQWEKGNNHYMTIPYHLRKQGWKAQFSTPEIQAIAEELGK